MDGKLECKKYNGYSRYAKPGYRERVHEKIREMTSKANRLQMDMQSMILERDNLFEQNTALENELRQIKGLFTGKKKDEIQNKIKSNLQLIREKEKAISGTQEAIKNIETRIKNAGILEQ